MVSEFQPLQQSDFTALAALANSKTNLPGRPYNFDSPQNPFEPDNANATIWTELARLRSNLFSRFQLFNTPSGVSYGNGYATRWPFNPSILVSETFSYLNINGSSLMQLQTFDLDVEAGSNPDEVQTPSVNRVIGQVPTWKDCKYVYSRTTGAIKSKIVLSDFGFIELLTILRAFSCSGLPATTPNSVSSFRYNGLSGSVPIRIFGVSEGKVYQDGSVIPGSGNYFYSGSQSTASHLADNSFNWARLRISDPPQDIYLNNIDGGFGIGGRPVAIDETINVTINSGALLTLEFNSVDNAELSNNSGATIAGQNIITGPASCPINGQWWKVAIRPNGAQEYTEYFRDFPPERFYKWSDPTRNPSIPFKFKLRFDNSSFSTTFQVNWLARSRTTSSTDTLQLFGANAADCTLVKVYDGIVDGVAQWHGSILCNANFSADMTFEVGIRDTTESNPVGTRAIDYIEKAAIIETQSSLKKQICYFERLDGSSVAWPVLDAFDDGHAITPPNFSALKALPWQESNGEWISPATHEYPNTLFTGNQAKVLQIPTNSADDFKSSGCWLVHSSPIGSKYFYEAYGFTGSNPRGLNRGAIDVSAGYAALQEGFPKSSPHSNDLLPPTYPAQQVTLPISGAYIWLFLNGAGQPVSGGYYLQGGVITSITIKRKPVFNSLRRIWVDAPTTNAVVVAIGRSFNNSANYLELFQATIPAGEQSITLSTFILIQTVHPEQPYKLQLLASSESQVELVAKFQAPMVNDTGHSLTGSDGEYINNLLNQDTENTQVAIFSTSMPGTSGFHLADHYNDTEAMLNLV